MNDRRHILVGPAVEQLPQGNSSAPVGFIEFVLTRGPLPKPSTLERWRGRQRALPLALAIPAQDTPDLDPGLASWVEKAVPALDAVALVVPTTAKVTPTARNKKQLQGCFAELEIPSTCLKVWAPSGLWEEDEAQRAADAAHVAVAVDPLVHPLPKTQTGPFYLRIAAVGSNSRLSDGLLRSIADHLIAAGRPSFVSITSPKAGADARRLASMIDAA